MFSRMHPMTKRKLKRFRSVKRGYYSLIFLVCAIIFSLGAEVFINKRALMVSYEGETFFPVFAGYLPGKTFGLEGVKANQEPNYRELQKKWESEGSKNSIVMPLIPYDPYETIKARQPPSLEKMHLAGTDKMGRDLFARAVYGFRMIIFFSIGVMIAEMAVGLTAGMTMGYIGGWFDSIVQRIQEILQTMPFLFVVMIVAAVVRPNIFVLAGIFIFFGWFPAATQIRVMTYQEKAKDYTTAVKALGANHARVIFKHIFPNCTAIIVARVPFTLLGAITSLTALDFLGFGLQPPAPSWGEILRQGKENLETAPWILMTGVIITVTTLVVTTFIGEAIREATDPKAHTYYE